MDLRMVRFILIPLLLIVCSLACSQTSLTPSLSTITATSEPPPEQTVFPYEPALPPGDHTISLEYGGLKRSFDLHLPANLDLSKSIPLVLAFHGFDLNPAEMARISGLSTLADQEGFLVAYPLGTGQHPSFNGGECCGQAAQRNVDDVGFTRAIIERVAQIVPLDRRRVYATGFSNGAIMVYRLACDLADQIAAIAPVGAAPATITCQPSRPVSIIHFHGDADRLNPYEGGTTQGGLEFWSVERGINYWLDLNGCPAEAEETQDGNIVHRVYAPCRQATAVELYRIRGGEHAWPGGEPVTTAIGIPTTEIDASELMWAFFQAHPMP